jgi:hypothetical protein
MLKREEAYGNSVPALQLVPSTDVFMLAMAFSMPTEPTKPGDLHGCVLRTIKVALGVENQLGVRGLFTLRSDV